MQAITMLPVVHRRDDKLRLSEQVDLIIAENRQFLHRVESRFSAFRCKQEHCLSSSLDRLEALEAPRVLRLVW
jgi:hypothetical protein